MRVWMSWVLGLTMAATLLPLIFGQLAVWLKLFKDDTDSVERSPLPPGIDKFTLDFVEAPSPEPSD